jgi:hypothetical protein
MSLQEKKTEFEPKIVAFLCNWCSYRGADLAGTSRFIEHGKMSKTNQEMEDLF